MNKKHVEKRIATREALKKEISGFCFKITTSTNRGWTSCRLQIITISLDFQAAHCCKEIKLNYLSYAWSIYQVRVLRKTSKEELEYA